jgi:hypothetical protein
VGTSLSGLESVGLEMGRSITRWEEMYEWGVLTSFCSLSSASLRPKRLVTSPRHPRTPLDRPLLASGGLRLRSPCPHHLWDLPPSSSISPLPLLPRSIDVRNLSGDPCEARRATRRVEERGGRGRGVLKCVVSEPCKREQQERRTMKRRV